MHEIHKDSAVGTDDYITKRVISSDNAAFAILEDLLKKATEPYIIFIDKDESKFDTQVA